MGQSALSKVCSSKDKLYVISIISTVAGLITLLAVLYRFMRPSPDAKTGFASLLTHIAFRLVAGPLWS